MQLNRSGMMGRIRRAPRRVVGRARRRFGQDPPTPVAGMVEEFSRRLVVGWVEADPTAGPVRVDLVLDDFVVASTFATAASAMSGADSVLRNGSGLHARANDPGPGRAEGADLVHEWQAPMVPGPADDRRNPVRRTATFSFRVHGIWPYVRRATQVSVQVGGRRLPIHRHGTFLSPPRRGKHTVADLRAAFDEGYLLDQMGRVSLRRELDTPWQDQVTRLYRRVEQILREAHQLDLFLVYGTLLGAVREGAPIAHDGDFDVAYLSRHRHGPDAAAELQAVAMTLIDHGLEIDCHATALHVVDPADPGHRIDVFHVYFDEDDEIAFPFGVAGTSRFTRDDWTGLRETPFLDTQVHVPAAAEKLVAHLYGDDWQLSKPGFNWNLARTRWASEGHLGVHQRTRVHWASFYRHHDQVALGSTFSRFVLDRPGSAGRIVDIGCGDGRDSCAMATEGREVLGLDASPEGVENALSNAARRGLEHRVSFATCDVGDRRALSTLLREFSAGGDETVAFYLRFFLHAIPEDTQEVLLSTLAEVARPGDQLFAEFRTREDEGVRKVHGRHYRRFLDAEELAADLTRRHGFLIDHLEEGRGLSPYGDEDPVLARLVATRQPG